MQTRHWRDYSFPLLGCVLALLGMSILIVYSATLNATTGTGVPLRVIFPRHVVNIVIGLIAMVVVSLLDYELLSSVARPLYIGMVLVLGLVLLIGVISEGAQSWIVIGTQTFQPAEPAKLVLVIALAAYWSRFEQKSTWLVQLGALALAGLPLLLVLAQPDLGTAIVFATIWLAMAWGAGIRWQVLLTFLVLMIPVAALGWIEVLNDNQKMRLMTFYWLNVAPERVDFNDGYNVVQAMNAIRSGGWFGAGLTQGLFSQGNYVPVQHSDFVFAVASEEMGFLGSVVLIAFQAALLWLTISVGKDARDLFGRLIAVGIFGMLFCHTTINIGMTMSLLPVTGLPLPLVSHGGTFMITSLAGIGLLQSIMLRRRRLSF